MQKLIYVPDTQVKPGVPTDHLAWGAEYIIEKQFDTIVIGGDWHDNPSCSSYEEPGSIALEGARIQDDIYSANMAFKKFNDPIIVEQKRQRKNRRKPWNPRKVFTFGNHEDRLDRVASASAKWEGLIGTHMCDTMDFERHPFLEIVWIDGVAFSHYFSNPHSGTPVGGTVQNRLTKIGASFVQGHVQGIDYGTKIMGSGRTLTGVVAGSFYVHREKYRGNQGQRHFRGLVACNELHHGEFYPMAITADFLCRKYEGMSLYDFHRKKYRNGDWRHLLDE